MWYVYVLLCDDESLYTGITTDVRKRLAKHRAGTGASYTRMHPPRELVYQEQCASRSAALKREAQIKAWSREEKRQNLSLQKITPAHIPE